MKMRDDFSQYYAGELEGGYDSADRMVINAYFEMGQSGGGFRWWWRQLFGGDENLDDEHIRKMAGNFSRRLRAYCKANDIPVIYCEAGARKHELAEALLPEDPKFTGVFAVFVARAPGPMPEVLYNDKGQITKVRRKEDEHGRWPYINHYYFQIIDKEWGHVCVRMNGYPPFGAQVIVNGHEWLECAARRCRFDYRKHGNCFIEGSNFEKLHRWARRLMSERAPEDIRALCDRWLYSSCACFGVSIEEQKRSHFRYTYSTFQLELSRNLCFARGTVLDEIYQKVIERTRVPLDIRKLKTIFGARHRPHRLYSRSASCGGEGTEKKKLRGRRVAEVSKEVREHGPEYNLTVFTVRWDNLSLKIYDKGSGMLRVEAIAHNLKALGCRKKIENLPEQLSILEGMLNRFLDTIQAAHGAFLDAGALEEFVEPTQRGKRRLAGVDLNKARMRAVVEGVSALATKPGGFKINDVVEQVAPRTTPEMLRGKSYGVRQAAYDLAKLRGKNIVHKIEGTRRYEIRSKGMRALSAYVMLREKVLKPLMAGARGTRIGRPPKNIHPIDEHYLALQREILAALKTMGLAA